MKDIDGDNKQILRTMQDQIEYLLKKVDILEEVATEKNDGKRPEFTELQKKRLAHRGKKLNEFLLGQVEQVFAPGTSHKWYRELIAEKIRQYPESKSEKARQKTCISGNHR